MKKGKRMTAKDHPSGIKEHSYMTVWNITTTGFASQARHLASNLDQLVL